MPEGEHGDDAQGRDLEVAVRPLLECGRERTGEDQHGDRAASEWPARSEQCVAFDRHDLGDDGGQDDRSETHHGQLLNPPVERANSSGWEPAERVQDGGCGDGGSEVPQVDRHGDGVGADDGGPCLGAIGEPAADGGGDHDCGGRVRRAEQHQGQRWWVRRRVLEAREVDHRGGVRASGDDGDGEYPEASGDCGEGLAGRQQTVAPGEAGDLEQQPAEHPVEVGKERDASEAGRFEQTEDGDTDGRDGDGVLAEHWQHVRGDRGVDRVVGKEPERDGGGGGADSDQASLADCVTTGDEHGPGGSECDGRGEHPAESSDDPVGCGLTVFLLGVERVERHGRAETADDKEQRHDLEEPAHDTHAGRNLECVAGDEATVGVDADVHGHPVADGDGQHGDRPVEVDRPVTGRLGASGEVGNRDRGRSGVDGSGRRLGCRGECSWAHDHIGPEKGLPRSWGKPPKAPGGTPNGWICAHSTGLSTACGETTSL